MRAWRSPLVFGLPVLFLRMAFPAPQVAGESYLERQTDEIDTFLEKDNIFILRPIHQSPEIAEARWLSGPLR